MLWTEPFVICGFGEVGATVARIAVESGRQPHQILVVENDRTRAQYAADRGYRTLVADATDIVSIGPTAFSAAGVIIICLEDTKAPAAIQVARALTGDAAIRVILNDSRQERRTLDAGADTILSLSSLAGKLLADSVLPRTVGNDPSESG